MTLQSLLAEAEKLSFDERLELVEAIWDGIAAENRAIGISEAQRAELHRRLVDHLNHPESSIEWDQMREMLSGLRKSK